MSTFYVTAKRKKKIVKLESVGRTAFLEKAKQRKSPLGHSVKACEGIRNVLSATTPAAGKAAYNKCLEELAGDNDKSLPSHYTITRKDSKFALDPSVPKSGLTKSMDPLTVLEDWYDYIELAAAPDEDGKLQSLDSGGVVSKLSRMTNSEGKNLGLVGTYAKLAFPEEGDDEEASNTTRVVTVPNAPNNGSSSGSNAPELAQNATDLSAPATSADATGDFAGRTDSTSNTNSTVPEVYSISETSNVFAGVSFAPSVGSTPRDASVVTAEAAFTLLGFASTSGTQAPTPRTNGATTNNNGATTKTAEAASTLLGFASESGTTTNAAEAASSLLGFASASGVTIGAEGASASRPNGVTATATARMDVAEVLAGLAGMTLDSAPASANAAPVIAPTNQVPSTVGQTPAPPPAVHPGGIPGVVNTTGASVGEDDELTFTGEQSTRPPSPVDSYYHHQGDVRGYYGFPNLDGSVAGGGSVATGGTGGNYPQYSMDYYDQLDDAAEDRDVECATVAERNAAAAVANHSEIAQQMAVIAAENTRSRRERRLQRVQAIQA